MKGRKPEDPSGTKRTVSIKLSPDHIAWIDRYRSLTGSDGNPRPQDAPMQSRSSLIALLIQRLPIGGHTMRPKERPT